MKQLAGGRLPIFVTAALVSCVASFVAAASGGEGKSQLLGFTADGAATQLSLEQRFDGQLNPTELRDWLKRLSSGANQVGALKASNSERT